MIKSKYVILGGGTTSGYAAEEFVQQGIDSNQLLIISNEPVLPMDKPPLSKSYLTGKSKPEQILINDQNFYDNNNIKVLLNTSAKQIDFEKSEILLENEEKVNYEKLLIATGAFVKKLPDEISSSANVYYLRTITDSLNIKSKAFNVKKAAVIGGQFIASEAAASLRKLGLEVTLVLREKYLMQALKAEELGTFFNQLFEKNGVKILANNTVKSVTDKGNKTVLETNEGIQLDVDMVVAGVGVEPNTTLFENSALEMRDGIIVNEFLETNLPNVYAAGDIARFPDSVYKRKRRDEHWNNAYLQGKHVAKVMAGYREPYNSIPLFFSDVFDFSYDFYGDHTAADNYIIKGDLSKGDFSVVWTKDNKMIAALMSSSRPDIEKNKAMEWIKKQAKINVEVLKETNVPFEVAII